MALPFLDNFNRANSGTLGANWTDAIAGWSIISNQAESTVGGTNLAFNSSETYSPDQSSQAVLIAPTGSPDCGPCVRASSASGGSCYLFDAKITGSNVQKFVNGSYGGTLFSLSADPAFGDTCKIDVVGTLVTAYINGVSKGSATDSALAAGAPGLWCFAAGNRLDDFQGDTVPPSGGGGGPVASTPAFGRQMVGWFPIP